MTKRDRHNSAVSRLPPMSPPTALPATVGRQLPLLGLAVVADSVVAGSATVVE